LSERFPRPPVTPAKAKAHSLLECLSLSEFLAALQASSLTAGPDSLRSLVPPTTSLGRAPNKAGSSNPPRLRSQAEPLSGFLASPNSAVVFHTAHRPWDSPPSEFSPRAESRASLEAAGSLAVIDWCAGTHPTRSCHRPFPRRPHISAVAWFPGRLWTPFLLAPVDFHRPKPASASLPEHPVCPGSRVAGPFRSASFTRFEAFFLSVSPFAPARVAPNRRSLLS